MADYREKYGLTAQRSTMPQGRPSVGVPQIRDWRAKYGLTETAPIKSITAKTPIVSKGQPKIIEAPSVEDLPSDVRIARLPAHLGGGEFTAGTGNITVRLPRAYGGREAQPNMQRDHFIPLSLGGTSSRLNVQPLDLQEAKAKDKVLAYALGRYKKGEISLPEARVMVINWRSIDIPGQRAIDRPSFFSGALEGIGQFVEQGAQRFLTAARELPQSLATIRDAASAVLQEKMAAAGVGVTEAKRAARAAADVAVRNAITFASPQVSVRPQDVIRELPSAVTEVLPKAGKKVGQFAVGVLQDFPRAIATTALQATGRTGTFSPRGRLAQAIFGKEPIGALEETGRFALEPFGATTRPERLTAGIALTTLGLIPIGAENIGRKAVSARVLQQLASTSNVDDVLKLLTKIKGLPNNLIDDVARRVATTSNVDDVARIIGQAISVKPSAPVFKELNRTDVHRLVKQTTQDIGALLKGAEPSDILKGRPFGDPFKTGAGVLNKAFQESRLRDVAGKLNLEYGVNIADDLVAKLKNVDITSEAEFYREVTKAVDNLLGTTDEAVKLAKQVFRTDKLNLPIELGADIDQRLGILGLTTRRVETFDDVIRAAQELGTDPESLLRTASKRRITNEEVVALRNLVNANAQFITDAEKRIFNAPALAESLTPALKLANQQIDDALRTIIGGGTEAGRAVAAYRILAQNSLDPIFWLQRAKRELGEQPITPEVTTAILDLINKSDLNGLATFISSLHRSGAVEKLITLWKAGLLTSPTTHLANISGNTTLGALGVASDIPSTAYDVLASLVTGKRTTTITPRTIASRARGTLTGLGEAKKFLTSGIYDDVLRRKYDLGPRVIFDHAILNKYTQAIFNTLSAEDLVFRRAALQESLAKQAEVLAINEGLRGTARTLRVKELLLKPTNEMVANAIDAAEYWTFNNPNLIATSLGKLKTTLLKGGPAGKALGGALEFVMPFTNVPANVAARIADFSPIGFVKALARQINPTTRGQKALIEDLGRATTGTAILALGAWLARQGKLTGTEVTPQERVQGKQPNSLLFMGGWRELNRVSPLGNLLAIGGELDRLGETKEGAALTAAGIGAGLKNLTQQTFLKGLSGAIGALTEPERRAEKFVEQTASSFIPSIVGRSASFVDPYLRVPEGILETIESRIPGLSQRLPVRRDIFGEPIEVSGGRFNILDPFNTRKYRDEPIVREAERLDIKIAPASETIAKGKLTTREYSTYQKVTGRLLKVRLKALLASPDYQRMTDPEKQKAFERTIRHVRDGVREQLYPALMIERYGLPPTTNPAMLYELLLQLNAEPEFKKMSTEKQGTVIKRLLPALPAVPVPPNGMATLKAQ